MANAFFGMQDRVQSAGQALGPQRVGWMAASLSTRKKLYPASVCGVESGHPGRLCKGVSVAINPRLWHCPGRPYSALRATQAVGALPKTATGRATVHRAANEKKPNSAKAAQQWLAWRASKKSTEHNLKYLVTSR
ncbi:MAG: hypothetical protein H7273_01480 [Polaromonas sp.]|nr:hypothetical protein [Polaromonas sp.]